LRDWLEKSVLIMLAIVT